MIDQVLPPLTPELYITNLRRSLDFYVGVLGFTIRFERPENGFAVVELDGACLMLDETSFLDAADDHTFIQGRHWNTGKLEYPFGRGINFQITLEDCAAMHDRTVSAGYPVKMPPEERWYRVNDREVGVRQFMVMDPDGFLIRFSQQLAFRPAKS